MAISGDKQMPQMQPPTLLYFLDLSSVFTISVAALFCTAAFYFVVRPCCRSWRVSYREEEAEDGNAQCVAETKPGCLTQVHDIPVVLLELRVLPQCGHAFHRACVDLWLLTRSSFCPICGRVVEREVEPIIDWFPDYELMN